MARLILPGNGLSGSAHLRAILAAHPDIDFLKGFQQSFAWMPGSDEDSRKAWAEYPADSRRVLATFSEQSLTSANALEIYRELSPDAYVAIMVRHPLRRLVSAYFQVVRMGFYPNMPLIEGLKAMLKHDRYPRAREVVLQGSFPAGLIRKWQEAFSGRVVVIVLEEGLKTGQERGLVELLKLLNLSPLSLPLAQNPGQKGVYQRFRIAVLALQNLFMYEYDRERTHLRPKTMTPAKILLCRMLRRLDARLLSRFFPDPVYSISDIPRILAKQVHNEVIELQEVLGRRVESWDSI